MDGPKKHALEVFGGAGSFLWPHQLRPIHPMPYVLGYDSDASTGAPNMKVSRASSEARVVQYGDAETNGADKIRYYFSPFVSEFLVDDFRWFQICSEHIGYDGNVFACFCGFCAALHNDFWDDDPQ